MCFLHLGSSQAYWKFLPILGPVANLQLSAPTEEEERDLDLLEERKILCFLEAISDYKVCVCSVLWRGAGGISRVCKCIV